MTRIEKIIVVVLGLLSLSFLSYIISSWTSQGTPRTGESSCGAVPQLKLLDQRRWVRMSSASCGRSAPRMTAQLATTNKHLA